MVEKNLDLDSSDDEIIYKKPLAKNKKQPIKKNKVDKDLSDIKESIKELNLKAMQPKYEEQEPEPEIESDTSEEEEIIVKKKPKSKKKKQKVIYIESSEEETSDDEPPTPAPPVPPTPAFRPISFGY